MLKSNPQTAIPFVPFEFLSHSVGTSATTRLFGTDPSRIGLSFSASFNTAATPTPNQTRSVAIGPNDGVSYDSGFLLTDADPRLTLTFAEFGSALAASWYARANATGISVTILITKYRPRRAVSFRRLR